MIGVGPTAENSDIPADLHARDSITSNNDAWVSPGNGIVCSPRGEIVAGPMRQAKGLLMADIDLDEVRAARRSFDVVGHYSRPDIFQLTVDRSPRHPVNLTGESDS